MDAEVNAIVTPSRLWSRNEVLSRPCPVPASPGVYGWYFRELPWSLDASDCVRHDNMPLLYVGIAPKMPPANGARASHQTLRDRIRYHYSGNAEGSTLRLMLGCLLADHLRIELRRVGSGTRLTFSAGEAVLSEWMGQNILVCWTEYLKPWELEQHLIRTASLPLNLDQNRNHAFHARLTAIRAEARARARLLPALLS